MSDEVIKQAEEYLRQIAGQEQDNEGGKLPKTLPDDPKNLEEALQLIADIETFDGKNLCERMYVVGEILKTMTLSAKSTYERTQNPNHGMVYHHLMLVERLMIDHHEVYHFLKLALGYMEEME